MSSWDLEIGHITIYTIEGDKEFISIPKWRTDTPLAICGYICRDYVSVPTTVDQFSIGAPDVGRVCGYKNGRKARSPG